MLDPARLKSGFRPAVRTHTVLTVPTLPSLSSSSRSGAPYPVWKTPVSSFVFKGRGVSVMVSYL